MIFKGFQHTILMFFVEWNWMFLSETVSAASLCWLGFEFCRVMFCSRMSIRLLLLKFWLSQDKGFRTLQEHAGAPKINNVHAAVCCSWSPPSPFYCSCTSSPPLYTAAAPHITTNTSTQHHNVLLQTKI